MVSGNGIRRIVLVANNVGELGGVGTYMRVMGEAFQDSGYDVQLLGFDRVSQHGNFGGLEHHTMYDEPNPGKPKSENYVLGNDDPRYKKKLRKYLSVRAAAGRNARPFIDAFDRSTAVIVAQVWAMENLVDAGFHPADRMGPIVFGQHHASHEQAQAGGYVPRIRKAFAEADKFAALTDEDARLFLEDGIPAVTSIPNPVSMQFGTADRSSKTIVALARYAEIKRLDRLVAAWSVLSREFPDWCVELWGDGPERETLRARIDEYGLQSCVRLMGRTDSPGDVLANSAVNVVSSDSEGLPFSIVEAARKGVPTVAVDCCPGIRTLIDDGRSGIVTPRGSVLGLVAGLRRMISDDSARIRMGEQAGIASNRFMPDAVVGRWSEEFERALR
ncbi:glycosyltransferase [Brevibacterium sp. 50QC2O2]|uniref:glycosyltransferase n=1 Tax=Brevibacterium TaxID=1696 RepID=UPI00211C0535|nr:MULTISPECIES: glycosyltransferase [unclassified Brevibacterium]MCQ9367487.1 glycosyltransferase [Brevibacterium sp. 91QC2O2]MCQ9384491.1 glycosyltransferase [Brevibacterium sp. 68QC2CO]MCQ9387828.1 glycosyltransferase [Brevibacterium sp. 50QC2O2]